MNGLWMGRYLRRWNRNTLAARQPLTNDGPSRGYCRRPLSNPSTAKHSGGVPLYAKRPCEPPPTRRGPGP